jgi:hypothetical protein
VHAYALRRSPHLNKLTTRQREAHAIIGVAETVGSALAPLLAAVLAVRWSLKDALQIITLSAWAIGLVILTYVLIVIPKDIARLRGIMRERAAELD